MTLVHRPGKPLRPFETLNVGADMMSYLLRNYSLPRRQVIKATGTVKNLGIQTRLEEVITITMQ